ncbi:MAG: hypothetical protein JEY79_11540 [Pseudodesulfovibrio sp.]|nr:hypothetical protein [Pseudodesulfovibrio sp.]
MKNHVSRRNFFGEMVRAGIYGLSELTGNNADTDQFENESSPEVASDFTPELLAMEAERLGLDPDKDKDEIIRAVQTALSRVKDCS